MYDKYNKNNKVSKKAEPVKAVKPQENYDVTFEVTDTKSGKKVRMTERFHNWEKVRSLKDAFDLMCYRGFGGAARLIVEEV